MKFYGQARQDYILWHALFWNVLQGYFVDVGAHDGVSFSNTLALEEAGWLGCCIEAHPDYIKALRANRPFSDVIHAAAGPQNLDSVVLHATPFGFLSTVEQTDVSILDVKHGYSGNGRTDVNVPMRRLDDMLHEVKAPVGFDLLCIDTEGYEVEVLKGFTLKYWRPRVIALEGFDALHRDNVITWMGDTGYKLARIVGVDLMYCRDEADRERLETWQEQTPIPDSQ